MQTQQAPQGPNVDLKNTTSVDTPSGKKLWQQGVLLRKVSKFVAGTDKDALLPIPCFFDPDSGKVLEGTVPEDLREEFKDILYNDESKS
jgi:hypothetical protein